MPKAWSENDERKYKHINTNISRRSEKEQGHSDDRAEEIAARTANKQRRKEGRTKDIKRPSSSFLPMREGKMLDHVVTKKLRSTSHFTQSEQHDFQHKRLRFFQKYLWLFVVIGLMGNLLFFGGSVSFLFPTASTIAVWQFILVL